jgi:hypothetical protein
VDAPSTADPLDVARYLCRQNGFFFTPVRDWKFVKAENRSRYVDAFVLYRRAPGGAKPVRICKCGTADRLLQELKTQIKKWEGNDASHARTTA